MTVQIPLPLRDYLGGLIKEQFENVDPLSPEAKDCIALTDSIGLEAQATEMRVKVRDAKEDQDFRYSVSDLYDEEQNAPRELQRGYNGTYHN